MSDEPVYTKEWLVKAIEYARLLGFTDDVEYFTGKLNELEEAAKLFVQPEMSIISKRTLHHE